MDPNMMQKSDGTTAERNDLQHGGMTQSRLALFTASRNASSNASAVNDLALQLLETSKQDQGRGFQQDNHSDTAAERIRQLAQMKPSGLAILDESELRRANLQAQALLKHQEKVLRNTRLLLQQQLNNEHSGKPSADYADEGDFGRSESQSGEDACEGHTKKHNSTRTNMTGSFPESSPQDNAQEGADKDETREDTDSYADDDELSDDEYFRTFDADDSNKLDCETFPLRLYRMLYEVEQSGRQDVVSFFSNGQVFAVHKPNIFMNEIMPHYFFSRRLASFQRQLNLYGFQRINKGGYRGGYSHECFKKGKRALCRKIKRQNTRAKVSASAAQHKEKRPLPALPSPAMVPSQPIIDAYSSLLLGRSNSKNDYPGQQSHPSIANDHFGSSTASLVEMTAHRRAELALRGMMDASNNFSGISGRTDFFAPAVSTPTQIGRPELRVSSLEMHQAISRLQQQVGCRFKQQQQQDS